MKVSIKDKVADRIAGAIVDLAYKVQDDPKVAVEVQIGHGVCHAIIETSAPIEEEEVAKAIVRTVVITLFALIFLFYTNSFLIRCRKKEFGLYHVLGMGKRNISRILLWKTLLTALFSLGLGLLTGILLSFLFLCCAVLIIYYKQISEGYEDRSRFAIMQKVGMSRRGIRRSINSQLLTVFFLPLLGAICHLAFAFPMITKMLFLFGLTNTTIFTVTTLISVIVFALFYVGVYRVTSNAYYHIVSDAAEE